MAEAGEKVSFSKEQLEKIEDVVRKVIADNQSKQSSQIVWGCFILGVTIVVVTLIRLFLIEDDSFSDFVPLFVGASLCVISLVGKIVIKPGEVTIERLVKQMINCLRA